MTDDEELIAKTVAAFAETIDADELDRHDGLPTEALATAAGLGLYGLLVPEDQGGSGGPTAMVLALDAVASHDPNTAAILAVHNTCAAMLPDASEAAAGTLYSLLATEEAHGSDKSQIGTRLSDGRLTGQKQWGLGAAGADRFLVLADGPVWCDVAADAEGLVLGRPEALLGLRASGIRTVYLSDTKPDRTFEAPANAVLQVAAAACLNGALAGAHEIASRFAESRVQFGKAIGNYQAVSDNVVAIDTGLAASRSLTLAAAARLDQSDGHVWAARAKAFAASNAIEMTRKAIRIQGGTGFMREGSCERFARDVRALQFLGEPAHVQRATVKGHVLVL